MTAWVIARNTFGEAIRKKILNVFLILALGSVLISLTFTFLEFRQQVVILKSFGLGMVQFWGLFIAIIMGISLIPADIEQRTIYTILSKPVKRYEYVLGRFLGGAITLAVNVALMGAAFLLVFLLKVNTRALESLASLDFGAFWTSWVWSGEVPGLIGGIAMVYMKLLLLLAVAVCFSTFATVTVNFFLSSAVFIAGSISSVTEAMSKSPNTPIVLRWLYAAVHYVVPNFGNYDVQNPIIHPEVPAADLSLYMWKAVFYGLAYTIILLVVGVLVFERKEV